MERREERASEPRGREQGLDRALEERASERKRLLLRLDPAVYAAVARWAADDLRSVNAQIEFALRLALRTAGRRVPRGPAPDDA